MVSLSNLIEVEIPLFQSSTGSHTEIEEFIDSNQKLYFTTLN